MTATADRPTLARKVTKKTEAKRQNALDEGVRMTIDGETYEVRVGDITDRIESALRKQWGGSFNKLQEELGDDPGLDTFAAFVWFCRVINGDEVTLDEVSLSYASILDDGFDVSILDGSEVQPDPEA